MREPQNMQDVLKWQPDWMGFIFYPPSPRYVKAVLDKLPAFPWPARTQRIGVFVSPTQEELAQEIAAFGLHGIQWHGSAPDPAVRAWLKEKNIFLIQVVSVGEDFDPSSLQEWEGKADYMLFDTKSTGHGGSGSTFDWTFLPQYPLSIPFLVAGGMSLSNIQELPDLSQVPFWGVDVNSQFETHRGHKNEGLIAELADYIHTL